MKQKNNQLSISDVDKFRSLNSSCLLTIPNPPNTKPFILVAHRRRANLGPFVKSRPPPALPFSSSHAPSGHPSQMQMTAPLPSKSRRLNGRTEPAGAGGAPSPRGGWRGRISHTRMTSMGCVVFRSILLCYPSGENAVSVQSIHSQMTGRLFRLNLCEPLLKSNLISTQFCKTILRNRYIPTYKQF